MSKVDLRSAYEDVQLHKPKLPSLPVVILCLFVVGVVLTAWLVMYYRIKADAIKSQIVEEHVARARNVAYQIQNHLLVAQQLAKSTASVVGLDIDKKEIEKTMTQLLESSPRETIYGIGVWFEPYAFDKNEKYFGPYVHRDKLDYSKILLTYEWSTPGYDYPSQGWYKAGKDKPGSPVFTEPYFDTDQIYMSASMTFEANGKIVGVITVDMVTPLLREYVSAMNTNPEEEVFILTAKNAIFVHPREQELMTMARQAGRNPASSLDLNLSDLEKLWQEDNRGKRYESTAVIAPVGWKVYVSTVDSRLFRPVQSLKDSMIASGVGIWCFLVPAMIFMPVFFDRIRKARFEQEKMRAEILERALEEQRLNEINQQLEKKVQDRTAELNKMTQELARLNSDKDKFFSVVAHDMRGVFAVIMGQSELIMDELESGEVVKVKEMILQLDRSTRLAMNLFENLSSWAGLLANKISFSPSVMSAKETAAMALQYVSSMATAKQITVKSEIPADLLIHADGNLMTTLIRNLANNAVKYSHPNSNVGIEAKLEGPMVKFSVSDSGVGISPEVMAGLFQGHSAKSVPGTAKERGTGLGLCICKEIVDRHEGRIWAQSEAGKGATIFFTIPAARTNSGP